VSGARIRVRFDADERSDDREGGIVSDLDPVVVVGSGRSGS
jgi:hypothetical protein